ncbi:MAG: YIP1 family protein [Anaerolineae bacterium]|nr:YIP1 family protein [Anaerolineae bacterium]
MTTSTESVTGQESRSLWFHLFGIIDRPVSTFVAVLKRRKWTTWALPLAVVLIAFTLVTIFQTPYTTEFAREQAEKQLATLPEAQVEAARSVMAYTLSLPFMLAMSLLLGYLTIIIGTLVQAAFLYFGSLIWGGDDTTFGSVFTMTNWSRLPLAIAYLVQMGIILVTQSMLQYAGLSFFVGTGDMLADAKNPVYVLLANLDLFWLWHLLLAVWGLSVVARMSRGKSALLVIVYAILTLGFSVGWAILSVRMAG